MLFCGATTEKLQQITEQNTELIINNNDDDTAVASNLVKAMNDIIAKHRSVKFQLQLQFVNLKLQKNC